MTGSCTKENNLDIPCGRCRGVGAALSTVKENAALFLPWRPCLSREEAPKTWLHKPARNLEEKKDFWNHSLGVGVLL